MGVLLGSGGFPLAALIFITSGLGSGWPARALVMSWIVYVPLLGLKVNVFLSGFSAFLGWPGVTGLLYSSIVAWLNLVSLTTGSFLFLCMARCLRRLLALLAAARLDFLVIDSISWGVGTLGVTVGIVPASLAGEVGGVSSLMTSGSCCCAVGGSFGKVPPIVRISSCLSLSTLMALDVATGLSAA